MGAQGHAEAVRLTEALAPYANGRQYLNFAENPVDARTAYPDGVWTQLKGIRSAVDPHGIFAANHPVPRTFENNTITSYAPANHPSRVRTVVLASRKNARGW